MYSIYDKQIGRLISVGRNSSTKENAKYDLLHYVKVRFVALRFGKLLSRGTCSAIRVDP
jgi:hypothetical protein